MKSQNTFVIKQAFYKSLPVLAGYMILGIGFGILLRNAGHGVLWALTMSSMIYAGSMQYVGVDLIAGGASVVTTILTTIMVNARHLFYSISMIERYKDTGNYKPYLIFSLTDETYSLLCDGQVPDERTGNLYRFLVSFFNQCYWVLGSVIGSLLGSVLPFSTDGIEFSMTALFMASFTEQWILGGNHIPALAGAVCSLLCLFLFGPEQFLIPSMFLITFVLTAVRSRIQSGREETE